MKPPLRVLVVIDSLGTGGAEYSLLEMLPRLGRLGIEASVVCLHRPEAGFHAEFEEVGAEVHLLRGRSWLARTLDLRRLLGAIRADLVHTTLFASDIIGRLAAAGTGVPVVTSLVNVSYEKERLHDPNVRRWRLRVVQGLDAATARLLTRGFHAITRAVADSAVRRLRISPDRITVIPRSRDARRIGTRDPNRRRRTRTELGIPEADEVVLAVGRQEFQKGHGHLVQAFSDLVRRRPDAWLVIAGRSGNASEQLHQEVEQASRPERILVLGHRSDVPQLLAAADVFAFPSLYEGLGGALLEAMAAGLPIVASDLPAIREVAGEAVALVPPSDVARLEKELDRLLGDADLRQRLSKDARRRFDQWPGPDEVAEQMATWYQRSVR